MNTNQNNFSLGDLENLENRSSEYAGTPYEKVARFEDIVRGIARKYHSIYVSGEDLEQDLWVKVMELYSYHGDQLDERFVAKNCYNLAVDHYRKGRRRRDSSAEFIDSYTGDSTTRSDLRDAVGASRLNLHSKIESPEDHAFFLEVINLFEKDTGCRRYVVMKMLMHGLIDPESYPEADLDELVIPEDDKEIEYLKLLGLGYNSKYPSSWGRHKHWMRDVINQYLGRD